MLHAVQPAVLVLAGFPCMMGKVELHQSYGPNKRITRNRRIHKSIIFSSNHWKRNNIFSDQFPFLTLHIIFMILFLRLWLDYLNNVSFNNDKQIIWLWQVGLYYETTFLGVSSVFLFPQYLRELDYITCIVCTRCKDLHFCVSVIFHFQLVIKITSPPP